jgi:hypothetical protein
MKADPHPPPLASRTACTRDFLPKPVQVPALLDMLQRLLGIEWIRNEELVPARGGLAQAEVEGRELLHPGAKELALLCKLAMAGRLPEALPARRNGLRLPTFQDKVLQRAAIMALEVAAQGPFRYLFMLRQSAG